MLLCPHAAQEISLPFPKDVLCDGNRCDARCRAENKEPLMVDVMVVLSGFIHRIRDGEFSPFLPLFTDRQTVEKKKGNLSLSLSLSRAGG